MKYQEKPILSPDVNTLLLKDKYVLHVDLPGIPKGEIGLQVNDNELWIGGTRKVPDGLQTKESQYGDLCKIVPLPEFIDKDNISAEYVDGVLKVTLPVVQKVGRTIAITDPSACATQLT